MEIDDHPPVRRGDTVDVVARQDLDSLSVEELQARVIVLEREIARTRHRLEYAVNHRASADALFRR